MQIKDFVLQFILQSLQTIGRRSGILRPARDPPEFYREQSLPSAGLYQSRRRRRPAGLSLLRSKSPGRPVRVPPRPLGNRGSRGCRLSSVAAASLARRTGSGHLHRRATRCPWRAFSTDSLAGKAVNRGDKRTRRVRDRDFVKFERSRRYRDRYRCQEKKSRRDRAHDLVFRDPPRRE
jgi:hypothetical protein